METNQNQKNSQGQASSGQGLQQHPPMVGAETSSPLYESSMSQLDVPGVYFGSSAVFQSPNEAKNEQIQKPSQTTLSQDKVVFDEEKSKSTTATPPPPRRKIPLFFVVMVLTLVVVLLVGVVLFFGGRFGKKTVETKKITWWNLWEDDGVVRSLIQEYETKNPNVKVEYLKQSPQDYRERLVNSLAKGTGPDIFVFHNTWAPLLTRDLDRVPASVASSADFARDYYYVISSDLTVGSGLVGLPLGYDALTLFINEDLFKEANVDPPTTWVELRDRAKILTKVENGKIVQAGVALGRTENVDHWQEIVGLMLLQNGVNLSNPEPDLIENALLFFTAFSRVDKVWDETLPPSTAAFAGGKLAMYFGPSWRYFNIKEANPSLNFRTVPLPQVPKEDPEEPDISYATYWVQGVWAKSSNKDLAWDFLKFISSRESLEKMYKQASLYRGFGEPYPKVEMGNMLLEDPIVGSVVKMAPYARSWYLASRTFDGPTGINSQIGKYFEDAINAVNANEDIKDAIETLILGIKQVLVQYGLSK